MNLQAYFMAPPRNSFKDGDIIDWNGAVGRIQSTVHVSGYSGPFYCIEWLNEPGEGLVNQAEVGWVNEKARLASEYWQVLFGGK